jgi:beta-ureidopropionase
MWVVCPIREQAGKEQYNTAVLINREGEVAGYYRKVFVFWGEGLNVSRQGVKTFDTDFGRIAILTCFDANFDELWEQAERRGAEIVFWPSAYGGGMPLNGYAMIHNYDIVPVGVGNIIDIFGRTVKDVEKPRPQQDIATLDLDITIVHKDFNGGKVANLLREHRGDIELAPGLGGLENWYVLRSIKPGVHVRELCRQYKIETLREYRRRSREQINLARQEGQRI